MNTSKISNLKGSVNVTVHKNYLKHDNTSSYAKVQRTTAGMNNVIAKVLNKTKLFDEASLVASAMLFKNAIKPLPVSSLYIARGYSVLASWYGLHLQYFIAMKAKSIIV